MQYQIYDMNERINRVETDKLKKQYPLGLVLEHSDFEEESKHVYLLASGL